MKMTMSDAIKTHAISEYPKEACGALVQVGRKVLFAPMKNVAINPALHFKMSGSDYMRVEELGDIIAIWHSHIDQPSSPSEDDKKGCELWELPWLITSVNSTAGELTASSPELLFTADCELLPVELKTELEITKETNLC